MLIRFSSQAKANEILSEIATTPFYGTATALPPNYDNACNGRILIDNSVIVEHNFKEQDADWLEIYCSSWIESGDMQIDPVITQLPKQIY